MNAFRAGGSVLLFGNGGSAADAQHIAAELVGKFQYHRRPPPAQALTVNSSALTAIGNDYNQRRLITQSPDHSLVAVDAFPDQGRPGEARAGPLGRT